MASEQTTKAGAPQTDAEVKLREALAQMKAATDRHAAVLAVLSHRSATPPERRLAQSESKKVERELQEAKRLVREAQALVRGAKVPHAKAS